MSDDARSGASASQPVRLEEARARLEEAVDAPDEQRLEVLEALHSALQEELDGGEAPSAGR
jgi:hypothetical protein